MREYEILDMFPENVSIAFHYPNARTFERGLVRRTVWFIEYSNIRDAFLATWRDHYEALPRYAEVYRAFEIANNGASIVSSFGGRPPPILRFYRRCHDAVYSDLQEFLIHRFMEMKV